MFHRSILVLVFVMIGMAIAFRPVIRTNNAVRSYTRSTNVQMNFFTNMFAPKKSATASHILVKDQALCNSLKADLSKAKDLPDAFAAAASKYSTCPSARKGGSLGTFKQGQMVPAFDKVIFSDEVGVVHGPVATPFGYHLILIEDRQA